MVCHRLHPQRNSCGCMVCKLHICNLGHGWPYYTFGRPCCDSTWHSRLVSRGDNGLGQLPFALEQPPTHGLSPVAIMLPGSQHALVVTPNELDAPFASVWWEPADGSELLIIHMIDDIIWVREYLRDPDPQPRLGIARIFSHSRTGAEPLLVARLGSVVDSYCTGRPYGHLPQFTWYPSKPADWPGARMSYSVYWLSGALDM